MDDPFELMRDKWKHKLYRELLLNYAIQSAFEGYTETAYRLYKNAQEVDRTYRKAIYWELVELEYSLGLRSDDE